MSGQVCEALRLGSIGAAIQARNADSLTNGDANGFGQIESTFDQDVDDYLSLVQADKSKKAKDTEDLDKSEVDATSEKIKKDEMKEKKLDIKKKELEIETKK